MKPAIVMILVITCLAVISTDQFRYASVQTVWKGIDRLNDKTAEKAVLPDGVTVKVDIPYISDGHSGHLLDVYYPESGQGQLPVIIYLHGGGFISGDKRHVQQYCMTLAKEGYVVFNVNYRLAPEYNYSEQIADIMAALAWIKGNLAEYHGDQGKIVLAGDSAGAYLAALSAVISTNPALAMNLSLQPPFIEQEIAGVLLFSGLYDLETGLTRGFPSIKSDIEMFLGTNDVPNYPNVGNLSVLKQMTANFPPTFVSSGAADWLHPESVELVKVLAENQITHEAFFAGKSEKGAFHDYQLQLNLDISRRCMAKVLEFLRKITG